MIGGHVEASRQSRPNKVAVEFDAPGRMRDGTVLRAKIYRPEGPGPWPVLLTRLPYGKDLLIVISRVDPVQTVRR